MEGGRGEGQLGPGAHRQQALGDEKREGVGGGHDAVMVLGALLQHLAAQAAEQGLHPRCRGRMLRRRAEHHPQGSLGPG